MIDDLKKMQNYGVITLLIFLGFSLCLTTLLVFGSVISKIFNGNMFVFLPIIFIPILVYFFYCIRFLQRLYLNTFTNIKKWILSLFWFLFIIKIDIILFAIIAYKRSRISFICSILLLANIIVAVCLQQLFNPDFNSNLFLLLSSTNILLNIFVIWSLIPNKLSKGIKTVAILLMIGTIVNLSIIYYRSHVIIAMVSKTIQQQNEYGIPKNFAEYSDKFCPTATKKGIKFCNSLKQLDVAIKNNHDFEPIMCKIDEILDSNELLNYPHLIDSYGRITALPNGKMRTLVNVYKNRITNAVKKKNKPDAIANLHRIEQILYNEHNNINSNIAGLIYIETLNSYMDCVNELYNNNLFYKVDFKSVDKKLANFEALSQSVMKKSFQGDSFFKTQIIDILLNGKFNEQIVAYTPFSYLVFSTVYTTLMRDKIQILNRYIKFFEKIVLTKKEPFEISQKLQKILSDDDLEDLITIIYETPNFKIIYTKIWSSIAKMRLSRVAMDKKLSEKLLDPLTGKPLLLCP